MRRSIGVWVTLGVTVCLMLFATLSVDSSTKQIEAMMQRVLASGGSAAMSYSQIVITLNSGTTVTYTNVTGYVDHENYISFSGIGPGSDVVADYEYNRSAFSSVVKTQ